MAKFFVYPFAVAGDKTAVPDAKQGSGSVSYNEGWGPDYALDLNTDPAALPIPRDQSNQIYFDITDAINQYQTHGTPDFITTADNLGSPYPYDLYAYVRYDDGSGFKIYENQVQGNTTLPTDPSWQVVSGNPVPAGVVSAFAGSVLPPGYLFCDGSVISRTTYAALFSAIGTAFGAGDGSTTFQLPFMARRVIVGAGGTGSATLGNAVGNQGGAESVALTSAQNGDHTHASVPGKLITPRNLTLQSGGSFVFVSNPSETQTGGVNGGAGEPHNNIQPSLVMNWIIKI